MLAFTRSRGSRRLAQEWTAAAAAVVMGTPHRRRIHQPTHSVLSTYILQLQPKRRNADPVKFAKRDRTANMRSQRCGAFCNPRRMDAHTAHSAYPRPLRILHIMQSLPWPFPPALPFAPRRAGADVCPPVAPLRTTYILQKRILPACVNPQCLRTFSVHTYVHTYFLRFEINSRSASGPAHLSMYLVHRRSTRARGARHTDSITEAVHLSKDRKTPSKDVKRQN